MNGYCNSFTKCCSEAISVLCYLYSSRFCECFATVSFNKIFGVNMSEAWINHKFMQLAKSSNIPEKNCQNHTRIWAWFWITLWLARKITTVRQWGRQNKSERLCVAEGKEIFDLKLEQNLKSMRGALHNKRSLELSLSLRVPDRHFSSSSARHRTA